MALIPENILFLSPLKIIAMYTPEQLEKLPKWAKDEIRILTMRLGEAKAELERINDNPPSNTIVGFDHHFKNDLPVKYLKNGEMITFKLEHGKISARIIHNEKGDAVEIHANSDYLKDLAIRPRVSNGLILQIL